MSWWDETRSLLGSNELAAVIERGPPCRGCRWFRPQLTPPPHGHNGFRLCQTPNSQYQDFSCFSPPEQAPQHKDDADAK